MDNIDLTKIGLTALHGMQDSAAAKLETAKGEVAAIKAELERRFGESAKQALAQAGKEHGTATLPLQDGLVAKADIKKTVKWDSAKLMAVAQTLEWERVNAIFKITFAVPETIYKGIEAVAPDLRAKIDEARTTIIAAPAITLTKEA